MEPERVATVSVAVRVPEVVGTERDTEDRVGGPHCVRINLACQDDSGRLGGVVVVVLHGLIAAVAAITAAPLMNLASDWVNHPGADVALNA